MVRKTLFIGLVGLGLLLVITGCTDVVRGNGNIVTEEYDVSGFNRLDVSSAVRVGLSQDGEESVSVETDANLIRYLEVEERGDTLYVGLNDHARRLNISPSRGITFTVGVDELEAIDMSGASVLAAGALESNDFELSISGASDVEIEALHVEAARIDASSSSNLSIGDLQTEALEVAANGSSTIEVSGEAAEQVADVVGDSHYEAGDLQSEEAHVSLSGASDARLRVSDTLDVDASGASSAGYYGDPIVSQKLSGASDLERLGR